MVSCRYTALNAEQSPPICLLVCCHHPCLLAGPQVGRTLCIQLVWLHWRRARLQ